MGGGEVMTFQSLENLKEYGVKDLPTERGNLMLYRSSTHHLSRSLPGLRLPVARTPLGLGDLVGGHLGGHGVSVLSG